MSLMRYALASAEVQPFATDDARGELSNPPGKTGCPALIPGEIGTPAPRDVRCAVIAVVACRGSASR